MDVKCTNDEITVTHTDLMLCPIVGLYQNQEECPMVREQMFQEQLTIDEELMAARAENE